MTRNSFKWLLALAALAVLSVGTYGQSDYGQLTGTVKDPNGAVVAGATVTVASTKTGAAKTATTNDDGYFAVAGLLPDTYKVTVSGKGFTEQTVQAAVNVGGTNSVNVTLGVAVTAVVDVAAGSGGVAEINTSDQVQSTVVNQRQISSLPVLDRNPYGLVQLAGAVAPPSDPQGRGALGVNINGQRSSSTNILLDGTENSATFTASVAQTVPQDSVEEFRVITSNFSAEYGRASGGVVNLVTKSGGNKFTGSAFEQNRNSALASNSFDNNAQGFTKPLFNRNQFGYAVSGPIRHDKLFFFNAGEWTRVRSNGPTTTYIPSPSCIAKMAPNAKTFFATLGAISPQATRTGVTQNVFGQDAAGNTTANFCTFDQYVYSAPIDVGGGIPQNSYNNVSRVDWTVSPATSVYFSYKIESDGFLPGTRFTSPYNGYNTTLVGKNQNAQGSVVHNFTSNLIFDAKLAFRNLKNTPSFGSVDPNTPTLYATANGTVFIGKDPVAFPGYIPYNPGFGYDSAENEKLWDFKPNFTYLRGAHNIRMGGQYVHLQDAVLFGAYQNASENIAANLETAVESLLTTGAVGQFQVAVDPQGQLPGGTITLPVKAPNFLRTNVYNEWAAYANDQWKITRNFTLNLGARFEYYGPQKSKEGLDANFYFGSGDIFQSIRGGDVAVANTKGGLWKAGKNWAPRLGFAWDVFGDGKTSVRGGYGIAYERNFGNVTFNVIQNPPFYAVLGVAGTVSTNNFGPLAGGGGTTTLPAVTLRAVDPNIKNAYAHQWGFSIERQIARDTVAKLEYSGSAGRSLYSVANINRRGSGVRYLGTNDPRTCPAGGNKDRLNCKYGNINFRGSDGTSNYSGVTASLESNDLLHTGITTTMRYTYSVAKDNLSSTFSDGQITNFGLGYLDPFNPMMDYGYADFDTRHRFVASAIYPITHKFTNRWANDAFGGWNISGIVTMNTGQPYTLFDCTNARTVCARALGGPLTFNGQRVLTGANTYDVIDTSGITPIAGTDVTGSNETGPWPSGMLGRNTFRQPGFWNVDASIFKNIGITERYRLQLRLDAFNLFNHANFFINTAGSDISAGNVTGFFQGNRNVQVSAKMFF